jgi:peptidoglycan/LPS O-acetylase OafA/YrhL
MKRLDNFAITRFCASITVLIFHFGGGIYFQIIDRLPFSHVLYSALTAVSYLFVLSGFVITYNYYDSKQTLDIGSYFDRRVVRIYPLYIVSFLLICLYYGDISGVKPQKIVANVFAFQAWWPPYSQSFNYASWFVSVLFFLYICAPFIIKISYRLSTWTLIWFSVILWGVTQFVHNILWIGYFPAWDNFLIYFPLFHLSSFFLGMTAGIWYVRVGKNLMLDQCLVAFILIFSIILVIGYAGFSLSNPSLIQDLQRSAGLLSPLFVLAILALALDKTYISFVFGHSIFVLLGEISYPIYILQVPVNWMYSRFLFSTDLTNPQLVLDITFLPLMIVVGLVVNKYIDPSIRNWMKNLLKRISLSLLILDLAIFIAAIFISFRYRFGDGREYLSYQSMGRLIFWSAFFFRTIISVVLNALDKLSIHLPLMQVIRTLLLSTTLGSLVVAGIVYAGYSAGWFYNFPRSIFVMDWVIIFSLSLAIRLIFRFFKFYKAE